MEELIIGAPETEKKDVCGVLRKSGSGSWATAQPTPYTDTNRIIPQGPDSKTGPGVESNHAQRVNIHFHGEGPNEGVAKSGWESGEQPLPVRPTTERSAPTKLPHGRRREREGAKTSGGGPRILKNMD